MPQKYLCEFYSYRAMVLGNGHVVADPQTALERQIQAHILAGNRAFLKGKYPLALSEYLLAWAMLPRFLHPKFPLEAVTAQELAFAKLDLVQPLVSASSEVLKWRDPSDPGAPIMSPEPPPPDLLALSEQYTGRLDPAAEHLDRAVTMARIGDLDHARREATLALEAGVDDPALQANALAVQAGIEIRLGNTQGAIRQLNGAMDAFTEARKPDGVAAMQHNLAVTLSLGGQAAEAGTFLTAAAVNAPFSVDSQAVHSVNPGIGSVIRPMGKPGLPVMLQDTAGTWNVVSSSAVRPNSTVSILAGDVPVHIDLTGDVAGTIQTKVLQPRINAATLVALETGLIDPTQFVIYLAHVRGYVLPLALGDTYAALGDYDAAERYYVIVRDYQFLNLTIERPMVWSKLAKVYLQHGDRLYRDRDEAGARAQYEKILQIVPGGYNLTGPLYSGGFAPLTAETLAFLNDPAPLAFAAIDYTRRGILLSVRKNLTQIANGINSLGFPNDIIPIHTWRYLQNTARYFATQAIQAERSYINFKDHSEQEEFTRHVLEQAVDAQASALNVEDRKVDAAIAQQTVAGLTAKLAQKRADDATQQKQDYSTLSTQTGYIDEITAFANAGDRDVTLSEDWAAALGIDLQKVKFGGMELTLNTFKGPELMQLLTRKRNKLTREYELKNMQRTIDELKQERDIANAQSAVADRMRDVADAQRDLAQLHLDQAKAQLDFFNSREFTAELWDNLAQAQRQISRRYLDEAMAAAFLMERAFELEYDTIVRRIRFDYSRNGLNGLMAGDFLLADIDQFSYDRLIETEKKVPVKMVISLADAYPFQFRQQFQTTGRVDFQTQLEDLDRWHPGAHLRKLRRVEVIVEGLVGPNGIQGRLTNSGISVCRDRDGNRRVRPQKPETMILSRFDQRGDGLMFTSTDEQMLAVFENSGVASGWILEFPPDSNDVDYTAITNIHIVLYFDAYHSDRVANVVRAELAATALYEYSLGVGLRFQFPDEFFALQTAGSVTFTLDRTYLPFDHTKAVIRDAHLNLETVPGASAADIVLRFSNASGAINLNLTTDGNGMISTDAGVSPFNAIRGGTLLDTWTVTIDKAANAAAFAAGFAWEKVKNIFWFTEYTYTPRGRPIAFDNFSADPMASFDVANDARATEHAPSRWIYDNVAHRVEETSGIRGPAGVDPASKGPDKPGTYLVRKTSPQWPDLADVLLRCRVNSNTNGGIGVVFRFKDANNFYFFLMDSLGAYRRLGRKVGGAFQELATPAVDLATGFDQGRDYVLTVAMVGDAVKVYLDDAEILSGRDQSLPLPGRVGFYSWGNTAARFLDLSAQPV